MFNYMINNKRFVAAFVGVLALFAASNAAADSRGKAGDKGGTVLMHAWEPGTTNWGQWQCDPNGAIDDDFLRWPDATATVHLKQKDDKTHLTIKVRDAAPNVLWTVWFLHTAGGRTPAFPSPLTGSRVTPMANPSEIPELIASTPHEGLIPELEEYGDFSSTGFGIGETGPFGDHEGLENAPNVFFTDKHGKGTYKKVLDFPLIKGAYPYNEAASFIYDVYGVDIQGMMPAPTNFAPGSPRMAIVSHCYDDRAHGLLSYSDERWFALRVNPFELDWATINRGACR